MNTHIDSTPAVPVEVQEQVVAALEHLLESFVACADGQHYEIGVLKTDFNPEHMSVKFFFRPLGAVVLLEGEPA